MRSDDEFYSVNRLVEFGLGLSVAEQMVKSMNSVMGSTFIPGAGNIMQYLTVVGLVRFRKLK
jgi:hypothetical protein